MITYIGCDFGQNTSSTGSSKGNHSEPIANQCQGMTYFMGRGSCI